MEKSLRVSVIRILREDIVLLLSLKVIEKYSIRQFHLCEVINDNDVHIILDSKYKNFILFKDFSLLEHSVRFFFS